MTKLDTTANSKKKNQKLTVKCIFQHSFLIEKYEFEFEINNLASLTNFWTKKYFRQLYDKPAVVSDFVIDFACKIVLFFVLFCKKLKIKLKIVEKDGYSMPGLVVKLSHHNQQMYPTMSKSAKLLIFVWFKNQIRNR